MEKIKELIELIEFEYGDCNCDSEKKCSYCKIVDELKEWKEAARSEADEVNRLQTENTNLKEQDKIISNEIKTYIEIDRKLQAENKKLREALEFYADPSTWQHLSDDAWDEDIIGLNSFDDCLKDCEVDGVKILTGGKRAREALKEIPIE